MSRKYWGWWNNSDSDDDLEDSSPTIYGRKYKSSLGWSSGKLTSTTTSYTSSYYGYGYDRFYSSKRVSDLSFEERQPLVSLVSRAYKAVRDMVVILDFPYQVIIKFSNYDCYEKQPGHKTIFVSTKILNDETFNENEKINIICGLGIHEASHLKYTDRKIIEAGKKKYASYDQKVVEIKLFKIL